MKSMKYIDAVDYKLELGNLESSSFGQLLEKYALNKKVIIVDENTHEHCLPFLITTFEELSKAEVILLPPGEDNKQMEIVFHVWEALTEYEISRSDLIINLGGGMMTDMGGFIASCYKRGLDFIHVPTSLLGMVDASIGGKTGINLGHFKNQIGLFSNPIAVFIDPKFLATLPENELYSGYAEMLKHAFISSESLLERIIDQMKNKEEFSIDLIYDCILVKNEIVNRDPLEKGERKILNFGHTIGHVVEGYFMDSLQISHGHSVAIGMVMESFLSMKAGKLSVEKYKEVEALLTSIYPLPKLTDVGIQKMTAMLINDKKNKEGKILCCLLNEIGKCTYDNVVEEKLFMEVFMHFKNLQINMN